MKLDTTYVVKDGSVTLTKDNNGDFDLSISTHHYPNEILGLDGRDVMELGLIRALRKNSIECKNISNEPSWISGENEQEYWEHFYVLSSYAEGLIKEVQQLLK